MEDALLPGKAQGIFWRLDAQAMRQHSAALHNSRFFEQIARRKSFFDCFASALALQKPHHFAFQPARLLRAGDGRRESRLLAVAVDDRLSADAEHLGKIVWGDDHSTSSAWVLCNCAGFGATVMIAARGRLPLGSG